MTALWAFSYPSPTVRAWLTDTAAAGPTVGGFLHVTLAAVAAGLVLSTLRWLIIDNIHAMTGLPRPPFDYGRLSERLSGFDTLVRHHYDYYKFHGNMLIAVALWIAVRHLSPGQMTLRIDSLDLLAGTLLVVLFVGSRDNLRNYYQRTAMLLGKAKNRRGGVPSRAS